MIASSDKIPLVEVGEVSKEAGEEDSMMALSQRTSVEGLMYFNCFCGTGQIYFS